MTRSPMAARLTAWTALWAALSALGLLGTQSCTRTCVAAGTLVSTPSGEVPIEELTPGDLVHSADPRTGELVPVRVLAVRRGFRRCQLLQSSSGAILVSTAEHPILDPESGRYEPASSWLHGASRDVLVHRDGDLARERVVLGVELPRRFEVFDLSLEPPHHNFVANGVVVHNKTFAPPGGPVDLSDFQSFEFAREPGSSNAPPLGSVHAARIVREGDGSFTIERTLLVEGAPGFDDCAEELDHACGVLIEEPPRLLTEAETQVLLEHFSSVEVEPGPDASCGGDVVEADWIDTFAWDGESFSSDPCETRNRLDASDAEALVQFLDEVGPPAAGVPSSDRAPAGQRLLWLPPLLVPLPE